MARQYLREVQGLAKELGYRVVVNGTHLKLLGLQPGIYPAMVVMSKTPRDEVHALRKTRQFINRAREIRNNG